ncbi:phage shock protein operon transcriptional activator [Motiliproteus sp. MSK22-1]|uniref:phage shock protein operon transcriptional activator n=1 Tax=Motiliproteus sp. MSK22-1 TaxID=1897630 RepID=UPI0009781043|nr:phage shock protein operon transcriptional activator [Motiliproteus sp. MSK22-1]OMH25874.1 phage shock protein operon transcriptional activator [Motiliproteus sp. MSK22-1]
MNINQQISKQSLIGHSSALLETLDHVSRIAPLDKPVLIVGERGTGKELIADRIHYLSGRWDQSFIKLNCASMNENLLESELFGHESGAFTGASRAHKGRFERADDGTLFLDELATSSLRVQEKLLRVIEYGEFERLGGHQRINTDVRLIAATNQDLQELAERNLFRSDLLDRLAFDVIHLPPLRFRQEDIILLAEHFAISMSRELGRPFFPGFDETAVEQLQSHPWPGNIRELKNAVERSVYRSADEEAPLRTVILDPLTSPWASIKSAENPHQNDKEDNNIDLLSATGHDKTTEPSPPSAARERMVDFKTQVSQFETRLLNQTLKECKYNQRKAAERLGLSYHQLRGLIRKHQLSTSTE